MSIPVRKICLLGHFAVGKTSLCRRFVDNAFSHNYHSTVGVNVVTKTVVLDDDVSVKLVIWDIAGELARPQLLDSYLRGTHGCLLVADGCRAETLDGVDQLHAHLRGHNTGIATVCLVNKMDLEDHWETPPEWLQQRRHKGWQVQRTSALSGAGVEAGFTALAQQLSGRGGE